MDKKPIGRPRTYTSGSRRTTIVITAEQDAAIRKMAEKAGAPVSKILQKIIAESLAHSG